MNTNDIIDFTFMSQPVSTGVSPAQLAFEPPTRSRSTSRPPISSPRAWRALRV
jgi:hypothetical protein